MIDESLIKKIEVHIDAICDLAMDTENNAHLLRQADDLAELLGNYKSLIEQNAELHKQSEKYKAQIKNIIHCDDINTGCEPSLSVFQREIDASKELVNYGEE